MREERYTCFPSLAFWSLAIVARTVAACSPPITDIRAFGHIYRNLGLKRYILNIKVRHCHISKRRTNSHSTKNTFLCLTILQCIIFLIRYINIPECLQHYISKCKSSVHFHYSNTFFKKNFSFLSVFSSLSQPTGIFLLNISNNFNSIRNLQKWNLKKHISHVQRVNKKSL